MTNGPAKNPGSVGRIVREAHGDEKQILHS
jgi:hypothetical protein